MELTKKDTKMIQGLSVMAMVCLHLFCRSYEGLYQPLIFISGVPLSFYIAQLSDFCVMGFALCSGYAHMSMYNGTEDKQLYYKKRLKSLSVLMINYWIVIVLFSLISILIGNAKQMPGSLFLFVRNILFDPTYNGAWWYMYAYILIVLISPALLKMVRKCKLGYLILIGGVIYVFSYYIRFSGLGDANWLLAKAGPVGMTVAEYLMGAVFFKYKFFSRVYKYWKKVPRITQTMISMFLIFAMLWGRTKIVPSLFVAPVTGLVIIMLFHFWKKPEWVEKGFLFIGKHATNIWLTHMFFYLCLFVNFVYVVQNPLLIFIFMMVITILVSMGIQFIEGKILKFIKY